MISICYMTAFLIGTFSLHVRGQTSWLETFRRTTIQNQRMNLENHGSYVRTSWKFAWALKLQAATRCFRAVSTPTGPQLFHVQFDHGYLRRFSVHLFFTALFLSLYSNKSPSRSLHGATKSRTTISSCRRRGATASRAPSTCTPIPRVKRSGACYRRSLASSGPLVRNWVRFFPDTCVGICAVRMLKTSGTENIVSPHSLNLFRHILFCRVKPTNSQTRELNYLYSPTFLHK